MKIVCSNCRTMNLLPETIADSSISRMTCARCGAMMDLPAPTPPPDAPEPPTSTVPGPPPVTVPSYQNYPPPPETITPTESATDGSVNGPLPFSTEPEAHGSGLDAGHPDEYGTGDDEFYGYDQAYAPEHAPPTPDRTGRFFKIAARLLFAVAILGGLAWGAFWLIQQYRAGANGNNTAGKNNPPRANLPPPVFTPTPVNSNSPSTNVNGAPNANTSPSPAANANNANTAPATPSPTPVSTPTPKPTPPPPADAGSGAFAIQVGSHPDASSANQQVAQLQAKGLSARAVQAVIPGRGTWYRVRIGHFASRDEASRYGAGLRSKGVADFYITDDGK